MGSHEENKHKIEELGGDVMIMGVIKKISKHSKKNNEDEPKEEFKKKVNFKKSSSNRSKKMKNFWENRFNKK